MVCEGVQCEMREVRQVVVVGLGSVLNTRLRGVY